MLGRQRYSVVFVEVMLVMVYSKGEQDIQCLEKESVFEKIESLPLKTEVEKMAKKIKTHKMVNR